MDKYLNIGDAGPDVHSQVLITTPERSGKEVKINTPVLFEWSFQCENTRQSVYYELIKHNVVCSGDVVSKSIIYDNLDNNSLFGTFFRGEGSAVIIFEDLGIHTIKIELEYLNNYAIFDFIIVIAVGDNDIYFEWEYDSTKYVSKNHFGPYFFMDIPDESSEIGNTEERLIGAASEGVHLTSTGDFRYMFENVKGHFNKSFYQLLDPTLEKTDEGSVANYYAPVTKEGVTYFNYPDKLVDKDWNSRAFIMNKEVYTSLTEDMPSTSEEVDICLWEKKSNGSSSYSKYFTEVSDNFEKDNSIISSSHARKIKVKLEGTVLDTGYEVYSFDSKKTSVFRFKNALKNYALFLTYEYPLSDVFTDNAKVDTSRFVNILEINAESMAEENFESIKILTPNAGERVDSFSSVPLVKWIFITKAPKYSFYFKCNGKIVSDKYITYYDKDAKEKSSFSQGYVEFPVSIIEEPGTEWSGSEDPEDSGLSGQDLWEKSVPDGCHVITVDMIHNSGDVYKDQVAVIVGEEYHNIAAEGSSEDVSAEDFKGWNIGVSKKEFGETLGGDITIEADGLISKTSSEFIAFEKRSQDTVTTDKEKFCKAGFILEEPGSFGTNKDLFQKKEYFSKILFSGLNNNW